LVNKINIAQGIISHADFMLMENSEILPRLKNYIEVLRGNITKLKHEQETFPNEFRAKQINQKLNELEGLEKGIELMGHKYVSK